MKDKKKERRKVKEERGRNKRWKNWLSGNND